MIGQILEGRYEIIRFLGGGQFGETYLARDRQRPGQPDCVVKRLKPEHSNQPSHIYQKILEFFEQEAEMLEKLGEHPQIPRLLAHFAQGQELFIVQEFIQGQTLRHEILLGRSRSEARVIQFLQDVLEVLAFVHQHKS